MTRVLFPLAQIFAIYYEVFIVRIQLPTFRAFEISKDLLFFIENKQRSSYQGLNP